LVTPFKLYLPFLHEGTVTPRKTYLIVEVVSLRVHKKNWAVRRGEGDDDLDGGGAHGVPAHGVRTHQQALCHHSANRVADQHYRAGGSLRKKKGFSQMRVSVGSKE